MTILWAADPTQESYLENGHPKMWSGSTILPMRNG